EVDGHGDHVERSPTQPREVEEVADQPLEATCLALDHESGTGRVDDTVREALGMPADRSQRGLQLVADGEEEGALRILRTVKLLRELVERSRELAELGRALDREWVRALAFGQPAARRGDA